VNGSPVFQLTDISAAISGLSGYGVITALGTGATIRQLVGTSDQIVIANPNGTAGNPTFGIADNPIIPGVESLTIPVGTTAERPVGQDGMIRYNTDTLTYETYSSGNWNAVATGGLSSISVATANGLAGTVANPTTTPVITMSTTVTGMVKGNGTALSAATAATDYVAPSAYASANGLTMATARLLGRTTASTGAAEEISVAGGLTLSGGVLTGGSGSVSSVGGTGTVNGITLTGTVTTTGDLTLGGTLSGVSLATQVTGTLPVANGGTGATTAGTARSNLSAAASGANTDITSVALTTGTISTIPSASTDIANKQYVDDTAQGLNFHAACNYASAAALSAPYTYNNGASGVGATITKTAPFATLVIDGHTFTSPADIGKRVLIKDEPSVGGFDAYNGAYTVTAVGSGAAAWVLTRATDFDTPGTGANQIDAGDFFYILGGTANANTSWVQQTPLPITVGTTAIYFIQFGAASGGVSSFSAGTTGLTPNTATTGNVTLAGTLAIANGGSGQTTAQTAINAFAGAVTSGSYLRGDGTNVVMNTIQVADVPTLNQNTTGTAANVTGTVAIVNGGTGQTTAGAAFNALSPITTTGDLILGNGANSATRLGIGANGYLLTSDGTTASWVAAPAGGVTTFSAGTTGLTPSSATGGAVTLAGTLAVANGGTGAATLPIYTATYLTIGGGGGASNAGGGAGGFITGTASLVKGYAYTITIGAGGSGSGYATNGVNGNVSWFEAAGPYAGGGGGGGNAGAAQPVAYSGASGGGGGGTGSAFISVAGAGTAGQGFPGGTNNTSGWNPGGGGGGAGGFGNNAASSSVAGAGGVGLASSITGSSVYYAGGGGGANAAPSGTGGAGGNGGGGAGTSNLGAGTSGTANTGGGGGGMGGNSGNGGNGGSGVVVLRILTSNYSTTTTGSPTVTTDGSYTVIKFTASVTYTA
jgi:hypothetical protein